MPKKKTTKKATKQIIPRQEERIIYMGYGPYSSALNIIDDPTLTNGSIAYYRCITVIANTIASLPFGVYQKTKTNGRLLVSDHALTKASKGWVSPYQTFSDFIRCLVADACSWGNGYGIVSRNGYGDIQVFYVRPDTIGADINEDNQLIYQWIPSKSVYDRDRVFHLKNNGNSITGFSPLSMFALQLDTANQTEKTINEFYQNGMKVSWLVESGGPLEDKTKLKIKKQLKGEDLITPRTVASDLSRFGVAFLYGGIKATQASINPIDAQLMESRQYSVVEICRVFGVPLHKVMDLRDSNNNTLERTGVEFLQDCLGPWIQRLEEQFNLKLLTEAERAAGMYCHFTVDGLMRGDMQARKDFYASAIQNGYMTRNEVRELEDWAIDDVELNKYLQPVNMTTVGQEPQQPTDESIQTTETDPKQRAIALLKDIGWKDENRINQLAEKILKLPDNT